MSNLQQQNVHRSRHVKAVNHVQFVRGAAGVQCNWVSLIVLKVALKLFSVNDSHGILTEDR